MTRDERNTARRARRAANPELAEKDRLRCKARYEAQPETYWRQSYAWRVENPERYDEYQARLAEEQSVERTVKAAQWKRDNPEKARANAVDSEHRRRARIYKGDVAGCRELIAEWKAATAFRCCGLRFRTCGNLHVDHIVPLAKGGGHVPGNLQRLCKSCNLGKGSRLNWTPHNITV